MTHTSRILAACLASAGIAATEAAEAAEPIVLAPPAYFSPPRDDGGLAPIRYLGQDAVDGRIELTATNGFFDRAFQAADQRPGLPGEEELYRNVSFGHLHKGAQSSGTARWHLWINRPGEIRASFHLAVPNDDAGHQWTIRLGDQSQTLTAATGGPENPQPQQLTFIVREPGHHEFVIDCTTTPPAANTRIHFIRLEGDAVGDAKILRARWRPAATHQAYVAPESCVAPDIWVFESEAVTPASSYSPITTPFGYFGTSFNNEGKVNPGAGINFSMWLARQNATSAPPIEGMPFIFATGVPGADFETFHHEGTGVKLRNAVAYPDGADRVILAMRMAFENNRRYFYGYFFDESASRWRLFAAGSQAHKPDRREPDAETGLLRRTGSFVEIPGPPARERSGDVVRIVRRRGWFIDRDLTAHRAMMEVPRGGLAAARGNTLRKLVDGDVEGVYTSRSSYYMDDFARNGWIASRTGGIENYVAHALPRDPSEVPRGRPARLPAYLQPDMLAELKRLPVTFGTAQAGNITSTSATINYPIEATGPGSRAILYYGTVDALTYPPRDVTGGSPALREMFSPQRTWQHATPESPVATGANVFRLSDLQPGTEYFFRLFVTHDEGKCWDPVSTSFTTNR